jgi:hypothetical protein
MTCKPGMLEVGAGVGVASAGDPPRMLQAEIDRRKQVNIPAILMMVIERGRSILTKIITFKLNRCSADRLSFGRYQYIIRK